MRISDLPAYLQVAHGEVLNYSLPTGCHSMHLGHPDSSLFPSEEIIVAAQRVIQDSARTLQYSAPEGIQSLREIVSGPVFGCGPVGAENVLITHGISEAIDLIARLLLTPGDVVFASTPTYLWAIRCVKQSGAVIQDISADKYGMVPEDLAAKCKTFESASSKPRLLYLMPTLHNPMGTLMPLERRREIIAVCEANDLVVFEDDAYSFLCSGNDLPSLFSLSTHGIVLNARTLSKIIAPGLRIGWVSGPSRLIKALSRLKATGTCTFSSSVAFQLLADEKFVTTLTNIRERYENKLLKACEIMMKELPSHWTCEYPSRGFYIWIRRNEKANSIAICEDLSRAGLLCAPGRFFFANEEHYTAIRISVSNLPDNQLTAAIKHLCGSLNEH